MMTTTSTRRNTPPNSSNGGGGGGGEDGKRGGQHPNSPNSASSCTTLFRSLIRPAVLGMLALAALIAMSQEMSVLVFPLEGSRCFANNNNKSPSFSSVNSVSNLRTLHHPASSSSSALDMNDSPSRIAGSVSSSLSSSLSNPQSQSQCRFYLAESAIPHSGLGIFTATGLHKDDPYIPDICIFVSDMVAPEKDWMHMRTHTWGKGNFLSQNEGRINRAACHGMITNFNTMPSDFVNSQVVSGMLATNAGLHRATSPGAGASTAHFGIHGVALDTITAGSELIIDYGDWDFDDSLSYKKPERSVEWLRENGWCIDNIEVLPATDPAMGRGAFARYPLHKGQVVAPAPLQIFRNRSVFLTADNVTEQLYVNYCLQPHNSSMLFFPYGQGVGTINHHRNKANVAWQWSSSSFHRSDWLDLPSVDALMEVAKPGGLVLEVVTLRDIHVGEELYLDYGRDWEQAWQAHVAKWQPPVVRSDNNPATSYVYPAEMDETQPLRTVYEQVEDPYPDNLMTMCATPDWSNRNDKPGRIIEWYEPGDGWWRYMTYCHILERRTERSGNTFYTVSLLFRENDLEFDPNEFNHNHNNYINNNPKPKPKHTIYIDRSVPRRAIRFIEKPYADDEHLPGAFRHPLEFPAELVPEAWHNNADA